MMQHMNYSDHDSSGCENSEVCEKLLDESESSSDFTISSDDEISTDDDFEHARSFYEIDAKNPPTAPPRFPFLGTPSIHMNVDDTVEVLQFFEQFFDDALVNMIVLETNRYGEQLFRENGSCPRSYGKEWKPTTPNEIRVFFALVMLQGIVRKPSIESYWSKKHSMSTPFFSRIMSYRRFGLLYRCLHFHDNTTYDPCTHPNWKLSKIWPVLVDLNKKFSATLTPERDISIEESLLLFKGRLGWKQYAPLKNTKFGRFRIKSFMLCESKSGYIWSLIIYTGKGTLFDPDLKELSISSQVVLQLLKPLLGMGYCVTTDNYYSSPELADRLVAHHTDTYGTVNLSRKDIPQGIQTRELERGGIVAFQRGKVCIMRWKERKSVTLLSTIHSTEMVFVKKGGETKKRPKAVVEYNDMMGVERVDHHLTNYPIAKKGEKKYYKKIFFHLMNLAVWNSYVLYTKSGGTRTHLQFRTELIDALIDKYHTQNSMRRARPGNEPNPLRLTERHFLDLIPQTAKKENPTRRCVVCSTKTDDKGKKIRRETRYHCPDCNVGLCVVPCFKRYHTMLKY